MTKNLKTLLLISTIALSVSACSHKGHHAAKAAADAETCPVKSHLTTARASAENVVKELKEVKGILSEVEHGKKNRKLCKLIKDAETLVKDMDKHKNLCDIKQDEKGEPVLKKHARKVKASAVPAVPAALPPK
jgi:hypothetical protein